MLGLQAAVQEDHIMNIQTLFSIIFGSENACLIKTLSGQRLSELVIRIII